jgi:hypothetical protein
MPLPPRVTRVDRFLEPGIKIRAVLQFYCGIFPSVYMRSLVLKFSSSVDDMLADLDPLA